ncbi:MAG: hypothetical protein AAF184_13910 [Pseudomonadota bacterium]
MPDRPSARGVLRVRDVDQRALSALLARLGLGFELLAPEQVVPGSYWGDAEAGLVAHRLLARPDTPVHSVLHEASHYVCMDDARRARLHTDAGGDDEEECAVCALQVLLADELPDVGRERMLSDMDTWGYTFRLGSARRWWYTEAEQAREWLAARRLAPL